MTDWVRFYELNLVCPLCKHDDACCISADGKTIMCCRVPSDTLVGKPFAGGWLHPSGSKVNYKSLKRRKKLPKNWRTLQKYYLKNGQANSKRLNKLALEWNVPSSLLYKLGVGWDGSAFTIPMYNDFLKRLR